VSDQDFNFNPQPRREAKPFEPPPWEQAQFEELAKRKAAEVAAAEAAAQALAEAQGTDDLTAAVQAASSQVVEEQAEQEAPQEDATADFMAATAVSAGKKKIDSEEELDPRIPAMLIGLSNEDPPFGTGLWRVPLFAGAVLAATGVLLMIWGAFAMAAARKTGVTGSLGGGILVAFGLVFIGIGGWMAFRTLRQQGVL